MNHFRAVRHQLPFNSDIRASRIVCTTKSPSGIRLSAIYVCIDHRGADVGVERQLGDEQRGMIHDAVARARDEAQRAATKCGAMLSASAPLHAITARFSEPQSI